MPGHRLADIESAVVHEASAVGTLNRAAHRLASGGLDAIAPTSGPFLSEGCDEQASALNAMQGMTMWGFTTHAMEWGTTAGPAVRHDRAKICRIRAIHGREFPDPRPSSLTTAERLGRTASSATHPQCLPCNATRS